MKSYRRKRTGRHWRAGLRSTKERSGRGRAGEVSRIARVYFLAVPRFPLSGGCIPSRAPSAKTCLKYVKSSGPARMYNGGMTLGREGNMGVKMGAKGSFQTPVFHPKISAAICTYRRAYACVHVFVHARARAWIKRCRPSIRTPGNRGCWPVQKRSISPEISCHRRTSQRRVVCVWEEVRGKETSMSTPYVRKTTPKSRPFAWNANVDVSAQDQGAGSFRGRAPPEGR